MLVKNCTLIRPLYCKKETNALEAAKTLRDKKQRRIIVVDEKEYPVGIISTTDMNNRVVAENKDASKLKAGDIMTSPIFLICDFEDKLDDVFGKMVHHESFFFSVVKNRKLYGVLTYGELIKHVHQRNGSG